MLTSRLDAVVNSFSFLFLFLASSDSRVRVIWFAESLVWTHTLRAYIRTLDLIYALFRFRLQLVLSRRVSLLAYIHTACSPLPIWIITRTGEARNSVMKTRLLYIRNRAHIPRPG